jgi:hypothetical protein
VKHPIFSALSLATLLVACAHDSKNQRVNNEATASERAEAHAKHDETRAQHEARRDEEGVEVPKRHADHDRVASANGAVPTHADGRADDPDKDKVTALDQGNGEIDLDLTQRIRKAVMADDSLSFTAKNAKIITRDGHVTLRGTVNTPAEKEAIYKSAVGAAGAAHVSNELEVDKD